MRVSCKLLSSKFCGLFHILGFSKQNNRNGGLVKTLALKLSLVAFALCLGLFVLPTNVATAADECSKELLLEYFPKQFVVETLKKFNVPQEKWDAIAAALSTKDKDVVRIVEDKASKLTPNPLKDRDPQQRQVAVKLFRETLLQVFSEALQANGITDQKQLQAMLDDIQQQKAKNFAQCMEKQKAAAQQNQQQPAGDEQESETQAPAPQARLDGGDPADQIADNDDVKSDKKDSDEEDEENTEGKDDTDAKKDDNQGKA